MPTAEAARAGRRYEVVDGRLLITGLQPPAHHAAVVALMVTLKQACPPDLLVSVGSLDFRPALNTTLRPDLLVCHRTAAHAQLLTAPPLLVVEVLSPPPPEAQMLCSNGACTNPTRSRRTGSWTPPPGN